MRGKMFIYIAIFAFAVLSANTVLAKSGDEKAAENAPPTCDGRVATIVGTEGDDILTGTMGDDVIVGLGGNDQISGKEGKDYICGGDGNDVIQGNRGPDIIYGEHTHFIVLIYCSIKLGCDIY